MLVPSEHSLLAVPKADVHSQQRFHMVMHGGELTVDQAHRCGEKAERLGPRELKRFVFLFRMQGATQ